MNRKIRNALILLIPALLFILSGILHPFLHLHEAENHQGKTQIHASYGLHFEEYEDPICPICSGELLTAGIPNSASPEYHLEKSDPICGHIVFPHDSTKKIHDPRAPPFL